MTDINKVDPSYRDIYMDKLQKFDPSYRDTVEFIDLWFINWNSAIAKKHGVTSTAHQLFALGDLMHDVLIETLTQKMEADKMEADNE